MKRAIWAAPFLLAACGDSSETVSNIPDQPAVAPVEQYESATALAEKLAQSGLPLVDIVTVTQENDDNDMLGRPNGYTSKVYFKDSRHMDAGLNPEEQNTIEIFANEDDATARREYIEKVVKEMPMFNQYIIQSGTAVMRLDRALEPDQAAAYEAGL